jgi:hypothetical protein
LDNFVARKISDGKGGLIYVMYSYCSSCKWMRKEDGCVL